MTACYTIDPVGSMTVVDQLGTKMVIDPLGFMTVVDPLGSKGAIKKSTKFQTGSEIFRPPPTFLGNDWI